MTPDETVKTSPGVDSALSAAETNVALSRPSGETQEAPVSAFQVFDDLARILANPMPRRRAFSLVLRALAGAVLAELGVQSAWADSTCLCRGQTYDPQTQCCTPGGVQQKHPLTSTAGCPAKVPHPGYVAIPNGCGPEGGAITPYVPNRFGLADFRPCCNTHDICYGTCNDVKSLCDNGFGACLANSCLSAYSFSATLLGSCLAVAGTYYAAVSLGGGGAFEAAQDGACDCCSTSTCPQSCAGSSCGSLPACAGGFDCVCFTSTEGTGACVHGATPCSSVAHCSTTADCPPGTACLTTSCCGSFGVCGPLCNPIVPASGSGLKSSAFSFKRASLTGGEPTLGGTQTPSGSGTLVA